MSSMTSSDVRADAEVLNGLALDSHGLERDGSCGWKLVVGRERRSLRVMVVHTA